MSYTTPRTWADSEVVTADQMNAQLRDNLAYLKERIDALEDAYVDSWAERAIDGTEYNATETRLVQVAVAAITSSAVGQITLTVKAKSSSPADTIITKASGYCYPTDELCYCNVFFIVPNGYYYSITEAHTNTGAVSVQSWVEWGIY